MEPIVLLEVRPDHIAHLMLCDRASKNMFSRPLIEELTNKLAEVARHPEVRCVVVSGLERHFCCGGSRSELLELIEGNYTFAVGHFYRALLDCPIPTIAAMAGHALGGGLVFGLYADIVILAEESIYSANFMRYGFTPGVGATCLLPHRLGSALAHEMLLTANGFHGEELRRRGVPFHVVKRDRVLQQALTIAADLASKPVTSLRLLKATMTQALRDELPRAVSRELEMHEITFKLPEVRARVELEFGY
ncbi:polyketide synthase [Sorangium sp. So ce429]